MDIFYESEFFGFRISDFGRICRIICGNLIRKVGVRKVPGVITNFTFIERGGHMPNIVFTVSSLHSFGTSGNGMVILQPALPVQGRLYVIWSGNHQRNIYVGTSANVQQRFNDRLGDLNNSGVVPATLQNNFVFTVRTTINNIKHQPNNLGMANGIDVEHLLMRIYINRYPLFLLRNTVKWNNAFYNNDLTGLHVRYIDPNGLIVGFNGVDNGGNFVQLLGGLGNY